MAGARRVACVCPVCVACGVWRVCEVCVRGARDLPRGRAAPRPINQLFCATVTPDDPTRDSDTRHATNIEMRGACGMKKRETRKQR